MFLSFAMPIEDAEKVQSASRACIKLHKFLEMAKALLMGVALIVAVSFIALSVVVFPPLIDQVK
jgi:hypothetical protein